MSRHDAFIPEHDRASVSEALEAALYCAAFQRMEEMEMKRMVTDIRENAEHPMASPGIRRKVNRRRRWLAFRRTVPKAAQIAAAFIAVLSISASIALAASPAARRWAAGALYSRVEDQQGFSFGEWRAYLTDGAVMDGKLIAVEDNESISVYEGTNVEPTVYKWRDAGERSINAVVAGSDGIYVIYADGHGNSSSSFNLDYVPLAYGLGCVTLDDDGTFDVTALAEAPATAILDSEGRKLNSYGIQDTVLTGGKLYFTAEYAVESELEGFGYAPQHVRLFSWDLTEAAPSEFDLEGIPVDWSPELFGGGDGAYLAAYDDRAAAARVYRAEDSALKPLCEISYSGAMRPNSFALREVDDALLYVLDGSVWMAQGMNADAARRIAVCGELSGQGLMLDDATYAVLQGDSVKVFDLTTPPGEVNELVVDGDGWNDYANQTFIAEHPDVAIVSDPGKNVEDIGRYSDRMLSGSAAGDVVALEQDGFERVRDAGLIAPLTDPELRAEWEKLPEGLRGYLSVDGQPAAIPLDVFAYLDVAFLTENWDDIRGSFEDYPDTWLEYIRWLGEYSHSAAARDYMIEFDALDGNGLSAAEAFEAYTLLSMADAYARCWKALGEAVDFSKPDFTACIEALEGVDWGALHYCDGTPANDGKEHRAVLFYAGYDPYEDVTVVPCTLRIREDAPKLSRASGTFVFVPAASTSRATAQEYLKTLAQVNQTNYEGSLEAVYYDFATDPEDFASKWGGAESAEAIRQYREQVGDFSFCVNLTRESVGAVQEATNRYVAGQISRDEWLECLSEAY